jgi:hypothetical protein
MTALVFVHGVNTRSTEDYLAEVKVRDQLFLQIGLGGNGAVINSSWGDLVTTWAWNQASLPSGADIKKDSPYALGSVAAPKTGSARNTVASFARTAPQEAVDELFVQLVDKVLRERRTLTVGELGDFKAAAAYLAQGDTAQPQRFTAPSDELFAKELRTRMARAGTAAYGLVDPLTDLVKGLADRIGNAASGVALDLARGGLNDRIGRFLGDVFTYLQDRGPARAKIREEVLGKLKDGATTDDKLVAVGHSMGGIILCDLP